MKPKSIIKTCLMAFALVIAGNLCAYAQKADCATKTEKEIVLAIYEKMKVKYDDQIINVNVRFKDGVITLEGYVNSKKARKEIEQIAKKTDCVTKVVNNLKVGKTGTCPAGYKECGGTCIPEKEICNICLVKDC